jgi:membrane protease subunit (stomatin/prohibitin family)
MGLFGNQFANVVEWNESEPGVLFYKWPNQEIKKGSKLIIRPRTGCDLHVQRMHRRCI